MKTKKQLKKEVLNLMVNNTLSNLLATMESPYNSWENYETQEYNEGLTNDEFREIEAEYNKHLKTLESQIIKKFKK